jgi:hypothetical protein
MTKHVFLKQYEPHRDPGPGTMGYMEKMLYGDAPFEKMTTKRRPFEPEPIGKFYVRNPLTGRNQ